MARESTDGEPALFVPDGELMVPTSDAVGPWRPDALHGAAVAALFGAVLDRDDRTVARVTVDITGTVPCRPLKLETAPVRGGRRVQRQSATLSADDRTVARATALYVVTSDHEVPTGSSDVPPSPPAELALLPESRTGWVGCNSTRSAPAIAPCSDGSASASRSSPIVRSPASRGCWLARTTRLG